MLKWSRLNPYTTCTDWACPMTRTGPMTRMGQATRTGFVAQWPSGVGRALRPQQAG